MIDIKYRETKDRNSWMDGNYLNATLCVTENCNLRCTYCYMVGKNTFNRMDFKTGKAIIDFLFEDAYTSEMSDSIMLDFIGGEPLLEIELIDKLCDYFILKMYIENHKWFPNYVFTFSTNGMLYSLPLVREYIKKHSDHCAFSISVDGTKEKHDLTRVKIDGSGSYDDVIKSLPLFMEENYNPSTKSTFASDDLPFLKDSIIHLWDLGFIDVESNLVYEDVWKKGDPEIFEQQLIELADYMLDTGIYKNKSVAYFSPTRGLPIGKNDLDVNRCGAGFKTLAFDYKGDIYPCIRFLEMCADNHAKRVIGNISTGVDYAKLRPMASATWQSQSPEKCNTCECGTDCGWCLAHNLSESKDNSIFERCTYICEMHKANARANKYFWTKYEKITGYTSQRTIQKLAKSDTKCLRYLNIITNDTAPAHCNYINTNTVSKQIPLAVLNYGLDFCVSEELVPIFLGSIPEHIDMQEKIYFEILKKRNGFNNPSTGITVINSSDNFKTLENFETRVVSCILNKENLKNIVQIIENCFHSSKRVNIFIEDLLLWSDDDILFYEEQLGKVGQIIFDFYKNGQYNYQINVLTDRLYASEKCDNDCGAGVSSISLAPNGKFYICPAFYFNTPDNCIGDIENGIDLSNNSIYTRSRSAMCVKCKSSVCNRCLYENLMSCDEINVPSDKQCRINYIEANCSKHLCDRLLQILPLGFYINRSLPELEYIDYVAAEIYMDERAEANRWIY